MPLPSIFHKTDPFPRDSFGNNYGRFALNFFCFAESSYDFIKVMPVNFNYIPVECPPLVCDRVKRHNFRAGACLLNIIAVENENQIIELEFVSEQSRLPDRSFI